jgi:hypothetical protein
MLTKITFWPRGRVQYWDCRHYWYQILPYGCTPISTFLLQPPHFVRSAAARVLHFRRPPAKIALLCGIVSLDDELFKHSVCHKRYVNVTGIAKICLLQVIRIYLMSVSQKLAQNNLCSNARTVSGWKPLWQT